MELDLKAIARAIDTLPVQAHWSIKGTPLSFDFSAAHGGLRTLPKEASELGNAEGAALLVFGEQDFAEGGGGHPWLCFCKQDGSVWGFDPERKQPMFLLNSSIERFIATFGFLHAYLEKNARLPANSKSHVQNLDPDAYSTSDWRLLVEYLSSD
jgi:hypothetical protein